MQLKPNTYYKTRDAKKAHILGSHPRGSTYPWIGYIEGEDVIRRWADDGNYSMSGGNARDLLTEWQDAPTIGSSAWANSLPVGTKVRWHVWHSGQYALRISNGWSKSEESLICPGEVGCSPDNGWLLYTEPKLRPWRHDEVPDNCWVRYKGDSRVLRMLIIGITDTEVAFRDVVGSHIRQTFAELLTCREHSTDGGRTWRPCGVEE